MTAIRTVTGPKQVNLAANWADRRLAFVNLLLFKFYLSLHAGSP